MLSDGRSVQAKRNQIVVRQLEPERRAGSIVLLSTQDRYTTGEVLSVGPEIHDVKPGDTLLYLGYRSGIELERDVFIVDESICLGVLES